MPGRFKLLDGIELTLVVLLLLVNGSAGLHPARHQAVFFGVIHARTLSGMPTVRGHADCLQGAMRLRGGKSEWRNEVGDANEDLGELEVNLDDLGLSMGEAGEADEWMNSEYERSSGGTWVEKPMAVVDDGDETSEEEGLKKRRESPKGFETNVGRLSGGIVKTSRREEKRKERNLKQEEQEKKKKEKKKKTTKEKNEGRDLEMPSGDDDVAAAVDSDKGSKKSSKTSLRRASERLVTSKDAEPGDKVVISASIENDPDYEGGFMKRFVGLVGVLDRPLSSDKTSWFATFPGYPSEIFPTGARGVCCLAHAPDSLPIPVAANETGSKLIARFWAACRSEDVRDLAACAAAGAPLNCRTADGCEYTPLHEAILSGRRDVAARLIALGADTALADSVGATALHCAATVGNADVIVPLVASGANVRARTASGCTPLHLAARGGKASVIEALLHAGALVGDVDARRATALHFAATMCRAEACRALLEAGAVVTAPTEAGESAVDKAKGSGHGALAEVLTKIAALQEDGLRQEAALVIAGLDERSLEERQRQLDMEASLRAKESAGSDESDDSDEDESSDSSGYAPRPGGRWGGGRDKGTPPKTGSRRNPEDLSDD